VRQKLEVEQTNIKTAKSLFSIFVELVQNVIRYSSEMEQLEDEHRRIDLRYGVITVGREADGYFVSCGNMIQSEDVPRLSEGLTTIASLDSAGLKSLYKQKLKEPAPEHSKGAGVGFIEIARQAQDGFEFDFETVDDSHSFFAVRAMVRP
jgi:two-component sensor histidine kinase